MGYVNANNIQLAWILVNQGRQDLFDNDMAIWAGGGIE
jgi:hypothetical protein